MSIEYYGEEFQRYANALKTVGVNLYDSNQNIRDILSVAKDMAKVWNNLTKEQRDFLEYEKFLIEKYLEE